MVPDLLGPLNIVSEYPILSGQCWFRNLSNSAKYSLKIQPAGVILRSRHIPQARKSRNVSPHCAEKENYIIFQNSIAKFRPWSLGKANWISGIIPLSASEAQTVRTLDPNGCNFRIVFWFYLLSL